MSSRYNTHHRSSRGLGQRLAALRPTRGRFILLGLIAFIFLFVAGRSGFYAQFQLWQEGRRLQKDIEMEQKKKLWLKKEVDNLTHDRQYIEREARKEHGLGEPDEIIVKIRE